MISHSSKQSSKFLKMLKVRFSLLNIFKYRNSIYITVNTFHSFSPKELLLKSDTGIRFASLQTGGTTHKYCTNPIIKSTQSSNDDLKEVQNLADILLETNSNICDSNPQDKAELLKVLKFLLSRGCTTQDIKQKCINDVDSTNSSYVKALLISELDEDMTALLPLMCLSLSSLRRVAKQARDDKSEIQGFPNRIAYLSHHLEKSPSDLIPALTKHSSLLTMRFQRLSFKMDILKNADISPEYIVKDLWIFNYNEKLLASRISAAVGAGLELKPWMLRCSESIFKSILEKYCASKKILGEDDEITYLAKRLECGTEYIKHIMQKNKLLKSINIPKLEKLLNFLYSKGYTAQEIRLSPRIFCCSVQTLQKRFEECVQIQNTLPTVSRLCLSDAQFKKKLEQQKEIQQAEKSQLT